MKKIKVIICTLLLAFGVVGCAEKVERGNTYDEKFHLIYFYIESCKNCQAFEDNVLPLIEEEFGDSLEVTKYSLDKVATKLPYDEVLANIEGFNAEEDYASGPFVVLEGYFALLGVPEDEGEEVLDDFIRAATGKSLGSRLEANRYLYKDTKVKQ